MFDEADKFVVYKIYILVFVIYVCNKNFELKTTFQNFLAVLRCELKLKATKATCKLVSKATFTQYSK